ncbi:alpha/beta fold hydrolase [Dyella terrae]|uniref:alpha/beta fold hydrolase n=1 Tax=Dyella terrae TaxID=522259 RepID=UPI001EFD9152|nr:alpha/beta fold hydrolase [Dyella terrae]ULU24095.1 alpha/beta fold hydrolase [Dyella terrae]
MEKRDASHSLLAVALSVLAALVIPISTALAQTQPTDFQFTEKPGPYAVGLKVVNQYDRSRKFALHPTNHAAPSVSDTGPRPIQTLVWYPASGHNAKAMTAGDYAQLAKTEIDFDQPDENNRWVSKLAASANTLLWAQRDAPMVEGRFPLVVYAPGQSSVAWDNADICEYLASHGYVVVASPSLGKSTRDADDNLDDINAAATDISFLISYAKTLPDVDMAKVAVAGWSWGGIANLFAATHDSRIKALVALDGSMRYYSGLIKKSGDIHPKRMTIPLLFFTRGYLSLEDWNRYATADNEGPSVLNAWTHGDLLTVHMLGMSHPAFASMYQRASSEQKFAENQMEDYGREDVNISYGWVARYTLAFLNAYLKGQATEMAFLKAAPAEHGVPKHFMSVDFRAAERSP